MGDLQDVEALRPFPLYAPTRGRIAGAQRTRDLVLMDEPQPLLAEIGERERDGWCPCSLDSTLIYGEYPGLKLNATLRTEKSVADMGCFCRDPSLPLSFRAAVSLDGNTRIILS